MAGSPPPAPMCVQSSVSVALLAMPASGVHTHVPSPSTSLSQGRDGAEKKVMCELGGEKKLDVHLGIF